MKDLLKFMSLLKDGYLKAVSPVCMKYQLTSAEFDVLMFLANNPEYDTATDIVERRYLAKSQVSISIQSLEEKKYLIREYRNHNRRTIHLQICDSAQAVIQEGKEAQKNFYEFLLKDFSQSERENMKKKFALLAENMERYVGGIQ